MLKVSIITHSNSKPKNLLYKEMPKKRHVSKQFSSLTDNFFTLENCDMNKKPILLLHSLNLFKT